MNLSKKTMMLVSVVALLALTFFTFDVSAQRGGRGGGGRGGGGVRGGGGGGGRSFSGGFGGARPSGGARPGSGASRPSGPSMSRPQVSRPSGGGNRPSVASRPNVGGGNRPNIGAGNRPNVGAGNRPNIGTGNRPNVGTGNRPNIGTGNRPGVGAGGGGVANRPATRPSLPNRGGGIGTGIGAGIGAGIGSGIANRPGSGVGNNRPGSGIGDNRPGNSLPGLGDNRPGAGDRGQNRRDSLSNRRDSINDRMQNRQDGRGDRQGDRQDNRGDRQDNRGDRQGDRQDNRGDRQDNRQENRGDRQDNRQDAMNDWRDNWNDAMNDHWGHHDDWHHGWCGWNTCGNWCGNFWGQYPIWGAFGITSWALNAGSYLFGLGSYSNPYYETGGGGYDYSQPIIIEQSVTQSSQPAGGGESLPPGVTTQGMSIFDEARAQFENKQYREALSKVNDALKQMPQDAALHEFKALCHFALGDYKSAAATLYAVLSVGPGWDWTTMYNLYDGIEEYTAQLRKLEDYCRDHKDSADAYFILAYHYQTMDKKDLAIRMYQVVAKLAPNDSVTKQMLVMLGAKPIDTTTPPPAASAAETAPTIPVDKLHGDWKAIGPNNVEFKLKLTKEGEFNWGFTKNGKTEAVKGAYGHQNGYLVLETNSDNKLIADVKLVDDSTLEFQMTGMSSTPRLLFKK